MATILLVDDHAATRGLLSERLSLDGHDVMEMDDATAAYERFSSLRPDLVLASVALPPMEDAHLFSHLRGVGRQVPLVVYDTGHRGTARGVKAVLSLGATGYIEDPTKHEQLKAKIAELLAPRPARAKPKGGKGGGRVDVVSVRAAATSGAREPTSAGAGGPEGESAAAEAAPEVVREGDLAPGRLAEILLDCWLERITGTIRIVRPEGPTGAVRLVEGRPTGVSSTDPENSLIRWLRRADRVDEERARELLDMSVREGLSQSGALVAAGEIEAGPPLMELLREHASAVLSSWFAAREGRFTVTSGEVDSRDMGPALEMPVLPFVREAASSKLPASFFQSSLGSRLDLYPRRAEAFRAHLSDMALSPQETAFAMKVNGLLKTRELLAASRGDFKAALSTLWFLHRIGAVSFSEAPLPDEEGAVYHARTASAGRKKKPLPEQDKEKLCDEALRIVTASYFGVLGLDITAGVEEVERAYHELATRFHPDSWDSYDLGGLDDLLQTVLDRAGAAYRILSMEEKREAYLRFLLSRHQSDLRRGPIVAEAEVALSRGTKRLEAGDVAGAEMAFQDAVDLNAKEPAYLSHLALAKFKAGHGPPATRAKQARPLLKKALLLDPEHEQANLVAAYVEQAAGKRDVARTHALAALRANPKSETGKALLSHINRPSSS